MQKARKSFSDFILHLHPLTVPEQTLRFTLSWGLGGMAAMLVGLLFLTGILLLLVYQPSTEHAYASVLVLTQQVPFGLWVRNIHHWSANLLVMVAALHLLRVVFTGAIGPQRRLNWIIGLLLMALLLASNFSGYLLPWDQLAYWAVTICTSMLGYIPLVGNGLQEFLRGGAEIGPGTLTNFYVLHVVIIPGSLFILMLWHFWLVRRAGGLVQVSGADQQPNPEHRVRSTPTLIEREAAVCLALVAFVLLLAVFWNAPLLDQANPGMSPNPAKAPWYFLGFQELLLHLHPVFAVFVWPLLAAVALLSVVYIDGASLPTGVWFGSERGRKLAIVTAIIGASTTLALILVDSLVLQSAESVAGSTLITRGVLPTGILLVLFAGLYQLLMRRFGYPRSELVMAGIVLGAAALVVCTIIGVWFRGPEMHLVWPWAAM